MRDLLLVLAGALFASAAHLLHDRIVAELRIRRLRRARERLLGKVERREGSGS